MALSVAEEGVVIWCDTVRYSNKNRKKTPSMSFKRTTGNSGQLCNRFDPLTGTIMMTVAPCHCELLHRLRQASARRVYCRRWRQQARVGISGSFLCALMSRHLRDACILATLALLLLELLII
jgi:hypothetical protein